MTGEVGRVHVVYYEPSESHIEFSLKTVQDVVIIDYKSFFHKPFIIKGKY